MGERRRTQRAASATRAAAPTRRHPPYLPTLYPVPRLGGGGGARCGGSQVLQRGEKPELRRHAAVQVLVAKAPAKGAPERRGGGEGCPWEHQIRGGHQMRGVPPPYALPPPYTPPYPCARAALRPLPAPLSQPPHAGGNPPRWCMVTVGGATERTVRCRCRCRRRS